MDAVIHASSLSACSFRHAPLTLSANDSSRCCRCQKAFWPRAGAGRGDLRAAPGRPHRAGRAQRQRQDHAAADPGRQGRRRRRLVPAPSGRPSRLSGAAAAFRRRPHAARRGPQRPGRSARAAAGGRRSGGRHRPRRPIRPSRSGWPPATIISSTNCTARTPTTSTIASSGCSTACDSAARRSTSRSLRSAAASRTG